MKLGRLTTYLLGSAIASAATASEDTEPVYQLEEYTVSVGPTPRALNDYVSPFSSLDADEIRKSNAGSLGELLDGQPGVTATSFGGGASRPIIRGFDGPRVRIVESGLGTQDVSETSPDHAVTVEPLLTERVEVLRGPATLLYGGSAIGGVVNVVGREIPREKPAQALSGAAEGRYDTVSEGETYLGYFTLSEGPLVFTAQGLTRDAEDYDIPGEAELEHEEHEEAEEEEEEHISGTLPSSFVENDFFSIGGSWFFNERSYFGASFSSNEAFYGIPGHAHEEEEGAPDPDPDPEPEEEHEEGGVALDMERLRYDAELAIFEPIPWIEALRVKFAYTDYEHTEFESEEEHGEEGEEEEEEEIATTFERDGWELRAEAAHYELGFITEGIFGIQISDTDFQAIGSEITGEVEGVDFAFGPPSTTRNYAFFLSEHIHAGDLHFDFGTRVEHQTIDADGVDDYSDTAFSVALGTIWAIDDANSFALSLQRTERHPNATELYANGPHLATSQYQVGDEDLEKETAYGVDFSYRHRSEDWNATASVFYTYFEDFIFDELQGGVEPIEGLDVYNYVAADAVFWGFETELNFVAYRSADAALSFGFVADYVSTENRDADEELPRIPPFRFGGQVEFEFMGFNAGIIARHSLEQTDLAPLETETDSFTDLQVELGYRHELDANSAVVLFARATNLLDEEIRHHTSFIKDEAPRPGRNFTLGARIEF